MSDIPRPRLGVGSIVRHAHFGSGRIVGYEGDTYVVLFRGGEARRVAFTFPDMKAEGGAGDPELDRLKQAMREVLGDHRRLSTRMRQSGHEIREGAPPRSLGAWGD